MSEDKRRDERQDEDAARGEEKIPESLEEQGVAGEANIEGDNAETNERDSRSKGSDGANAAEDILASGAASAGGGNAGGSGRRRNRGAASGTNGGRRRRSFSKGSAQEALTRDDGASEGTTGEQPAREQQREEQQEHQQEHQRESTRADHEPERSAVDEVGERSEAKEPGFTEASTEAGEDPDPVADEALDEMLERAVDELLKTFSVEETDELLAEVAEISPQTRALNKTTINLSHKHARLLDDVKRALKVAGFNGNQATTSNVMAVGLILYKRVLDLDRQRTEDY